MMKFSGVMEMFCILTGIGVTQLYEFVKKHQTLDLRSVQNLYKFYLKKLILSK